MNSIINSSGIYDINSYNLIIYDNIINKPDLATTANLNNLSTNSTLSINGHTTQISDLNNTSTAIFNNLNSLSTYSNLNISNLQ